VNLSTFLDNTDNQQITDFNLSGTDLTITLEDGGTKTISLASLDNNGSDDQQITLVGNTLTLEDGGTVDLSAYLDNTDEQNLSLVGSTLSLSNSPDVNLSAFLDNTDNQQIADFNLSGTDLTITLEDGGTKTISLASLDNNGSDDQNIEGSAFDAGTSALTIGIENGTSQDVDLSSLDESADIIVLETALLGHINDDNDTNNTNEIQTLTSTDGSVTLTKTGNDYDLSVATETVTTLVADPSPTQLEYTYTNEAAATTKFRSSPIVAFGKVNSDGTLARGYGATVVRNSAGNYSVTLDTARATANYTIQLTIIDANGAGRDDYDAAYSGQTTTGFVVETGDNDNGNTDRQALDSEFMFTVIDY
jgi:hypothetical protein